MEAVREHELDARQIIATLSVVVAWTYLILKGIDLADLADVRHRQQLMAAVALCVGTSVSSTAAA